MVYFYVRHLSHIPRHVMVAASVTDTLQRSCFLLATCVTVRPQSVLPQTSNPGVDRWNAAVVPGAKKVCSWGN